MKRFKFTLQTVYEYKQTVEKTQKADLARAQAILRELMRQDEELNAAFLRNSEAREAELAAGTADARALEEYDAFFRYVREQRARLAVKIANAEEVRRRCQEALITTMKELKAYEKLKTKQYEQYLKDVAAEEEKELGDIVSFSTIQDGK